MTPTIRTSVKEEAIIKALKETGSYRRAVRMVRISRSALTEWRNDDAEFNQRCQEALALGREHRADDIEDKFLDVAMNPKHPQYVTAAIFALKNLRRETYQERQHLEHSGVVSFADLAGIAAADAESS